MVGGGNGKNNYHLKFKKKKKDNEKKTLTADKGDWGQGKLHYTHDWIMS